MGPSHATVKPRASVMYGSGLAVSLQIIGSLAEVGSDHWSGECPRNVYAALLQDRDELSQQKAGGCFKGFGLNERIFNGIFQLNVMETSWNSSFSWCITSFNKQESSPLFKCPAVLQVLLVGKEAWKAYRDVGADLPLRGPGIERRADSRWR